MLDGDRDALPRLLKEVGAALAAREEEMRRDGRVYPGVRAVLEALDAREDVVQSLLTGNIEVNAALKLGAFGLERWLDFEVGAYGSDPHEERSDLVAVARERAAAKHGEPTAAVLVGDTPLDVRAAHEAGARAVAVATGLSDVQALEGSATGGGAGGPQRHRRGRGGDRRVAPPRPRAAPSPRCAGRASGGSGWPRRAR